MTPSSSVALFHVGLTIALKYALKVLRNCTRDNRPRDVWLRCDGTFLLSSLQSLDGAESKNVEAASGTVLAVFQVTSVIPHPAEWQPPHHSVGRPRLPTRPPRRGSLIQFHTLNKDAEKRILYIKLALFCSLLTAMHQASTETVS